MVSGKIRKNTLFAFAVLFSSLGSSVWAQDLPYYDELRDPAGRIRPQYEKAHEIYKGMRAKAKKEFLKKSKADFRGDNVLDPLPRLLTKGEYETLRTGVEQRGTAIRMFLQDHYSGKKTYQSVLPEPVLSRIITRSAETSYSGLVNPDTISFPYGPDIIRTANGKWAVIEDNPGFIGGPGDLHIARESMLKHEPKYRDVKFLHGPEEYYENIVARAKTRAKPKSGKIVILMSPPYADNEDHRLKKLFGDRGVEIVTPNTKKKLVMTDKGAVLEHTNKAGKRIRENVGFVFLNAEHKWSDATHPASFRSLLVAEAESSIEWLDEMKTPEARAEAMALRRALDPDPVSGIVDYTHLEKQVRKTPNNLSEIRRASVPGLTDAMMSGKVVTNYSPGVDFIGDKEFYTYVDDLIRHYLKEEPIITNLPTFRLGKQAADGTAKVDAELMKRLFKDGDYKKFVIKKVDGRGGDGVWIGPKLTEADLPELIRRIEASPEYFIAQEFNHLSTIEDRIVDLRLIADVNPESVYVTRTPWGRGVPMSGNGKVNLSDKGREFMVGVVADPIPHCVRDMLKTVLGK
ncbi:MAG: hypothetical protein A2X94_06495 [Bdellovibrionales bacterium GWB1_55_8]|nr:MAG: hypothetical protein A2X94_06495 [Bdellovibrionales bacterium GWB1_55_8]